MEMRQLLLRGSLCLPVFFFASAHADIYRCQQPDGALQFSDQPCPEGRAETVQLRENSPLDSSAERAIIARHDRPRSRQVAAGPHIVLIGDSYTEQRNARITAEEQRADRQRWNKGKRKKKPARKKR